MIESYIALMLLFAVVCDFACNSHVILPIYKGKLNYNLWMNSLTNNINRPTSMKDASIEYSNNLNLYSNQRLHCISELSMKAVFDSIVNAKFHP